MFSKKSKILIYMILSLFILNFILPIYSFAIDNDSIYVWSNTSSSVSTSTVPTEEPENVNQDNSRKLFRHHLWQRYINGPKNRNCFV